jgi:MFS family permease
MAARGARRDQWVLLLGFGLGSFAWNLCWPFLPLRVEAVGITALGEVARLTGLLAGFSNLITALLGTFWVLLGERFGYRLQVMRAHTGTALSMALVGLARTPLALTGSVVSLGALGGNYPHYLALAAASAAPSEVGQVIGDLQAAGQIGSTLGPLVGGVIVAQVGLTTAFLASSLVSLGGLMVALTLIRPVRPPAGQPRAARGNLGAAWRRADLRLLMLLFPIADSGVQGLRPLIPVIISTRITDPAAVATATGLIATVAMAGTVVAALLVGRLSRSVSPARILIATLPVTALAAGLIPFATDVPGMLLVWGALGLASGATTPAIFAWLGRLTPGGDGGPYALLATVNMIDFALGPALLGQASVYGLEWPCRLTAVTLLLAVLLVVVGPRAVTPVARLADRPTST